FDQRDGQDPRHDRNGRARRAAPRPHDNRQEVRAGLMETNELIKVLSADAAVGQPSFGRAWALAIVLAVLIAAAIFLIFIRARPDVDEAAETMRFLFKFVVTGLLAITAVPAMLALARPETVGRRKIAVIAVAPLVLAAGVLLELMSVPAAEWGTR